LSHNGSSLTLNQSSPTLPVWPECGCHVDMEKTGCKGHAYHTRYQNDDGDVAASVLDLNLPDNAVDWSVTMEMDVAVAGLAPRSASAGANVLPTGNFVMVVNPTASADFAEKTHRIEVEYDFDVRAGTASRVTLIMAFLLQSMEAQPHWRHPCVVKLNCTIQVKEDSDHKMLWFVLLVTGVSVILLMVICFVICYFVKESGDAATMTATVSPVQSPS